MAFNNSKVTIREIEYSIRIRDKDSTFSELIDVLRNELTSFRHNPKPKQAATESIIHDFIQVNIERSIVIRENTRVYFLNYKEKEGSLRIGFTLLIITNYLHFAPLRQELDSYIKDSIAGYFEELLERHTPVSITVASTDREIATLADTAGMQKTSHRPKRIQLSTLVAVSALVISLCIAGVVGFQAFKTKHQAENYKLKEDYIDVLLEKKIMEAVKDQKFTINLYKIADTIGNTRNTVSERKEK